MPLLLRRGLEADRLSFVPEEGELIYVTDTKRVYVGDGVTPGGILVAGGGEEPTPTPTYSLSRSAASVDEGQSFTITLETTNVTDGTLVPYTITGVSSADINGASLSGNFTVNSNTASLVVNTTADSLTEGNETFTITLVGITPTTNISVTIVDTSTSPIGDEIDGGGPDTTVFDFVIDCGDPDSTEFDPIIDGGIIA
jgi:hypothetical protein